MTRRPRPVIDRILGSHLVVPLIGIADANGQPYTATAVLATEHTIPYALEGFTRRRAPAVAQDLIDQDAPDWGAHGRQRERRRPSCGSS